MYQRLLLLMAGIALSFASVAQQLKPVGDSSSVAFTIKNFGLSVSGSFKGLKGTIQFDPQHLGASSFAVTVDASTVNTGIDMRDNHLRKEEYFSVADHPLISFNSTKITASNKDGYLFIFGDLTIKGVTKSISFPFRAVPNGNGYTFSGSFSFNRKDFGVGGSSISMSDKVNVELRVVAQ
jgi:polyisoprenoid-binding protein YceI